MAFRRESCLYAHRRGRSASDRRDLAERDTPEPVSGKGERHRLGRRRECDSGKNRDESLTFRPPRPRALMAHRTCGGRSQEGSLRRRCTRSPSLPRLTTSVGKQIGAQGNTTGLAKKNGGHQ